MPTAIDVLVKDGSGDGLRAEPELCAMSYDSSDEPTEVTVLIKEGGGGDESTEEEWTGGVPLAEVYSLSDYDTESRSTPPPAMSKKMPKKALGLLTESGCSNNAKLTQQVQGGDSKKNASPQKERIAALGCKKVALFVNGGGSDNTSSLLNDVKDTNDVDLTNTTTGKDGIEVDRTIVSGGSFEARDAATLANKGSAPKGGNGELVRGHADAYPMENIEVPGVNDCLAVRGRGAYYQLGNKRYRKLPENYCKLVERKKDEYRNAHHKQLVAMEMVHEWRAMDPPGRFLKRDKETGKWNDVGDVKAMQKVMIALREKTPPQVESSSGDYNQGRELNEVDSALSNHMSATLTILRQTSAKGEKSVPQALIDHVREETVTALRNANYSFPLSKALSEAESAAARLMTVEMRQQQQQHQRLDTVDDGSSENEATSKSETKSVLTTSIVSNNDLPTGVSSKPKRPRCDNDNGQNKKRTKKQCSHEGCDKQTCKEEGLCWKHGAKAVAKRCSYEGCAKYAKNGGVCVKHGAEVKRCSYEGCAKYAKNGGVCVKHGAKVKVKRCSYEGCAKYAKNGGVCFKHGAKVKVKRKLCGYERCANFAVKGGVCVRHGAKVKLCSYEGCAKYAKNGGVCVKHGAKVERKLCGYERCANFAVKGGVCKRHGAKDLA